MPSGAKELKATRCPFCHAGFGGENEVVCSSCLARHHAECWRESGSCASCRTRAGLQKAPSRGSWRLALGLVAAALPGWIAYAASVRSRAVEENIYGSRAALVPIAVASHDLKAGQVVGREDLVEHEVPVSLARKISYFSTNGVVGLELAADARAGDIFQPFHFQIRGESKPATGDVARFSKQIEGTAWKMSSAGWTGKIVFKSGGVYVTDWGTGSWKAGPVGHLSLKNDHDGYSHMLVVSEDLTAFKGTRSDGEAEVGGLLKPLPSEEKVEASSKKVDDDPLPFFIEARKSERRARECLANEKNWTVEEVAAYLVETSKRYAAAGRKDDAARTRAAAEALVEGKDRAHAFRILDKKSLDALIEVRAMLSSALDELRGVAAGTNHPSYVFSAAKTLAHVAGLIATSSPDESAKLAAIADELSRNSSFVTKAIESVENVRSKLDGKSP